MPLANWKQLAFTDRTHCDQFVKIMRAMDPRYRALTSELLQTWLEGTKGPYVGNVVAAFAWFPQVGDLPHPARMQMVFLIKFDPASERAKLMMLGWTPATPDCTPAVLDAAIDELLTQGANWLSTLTANPPMKEVAAFRPYEMANLQVMRLHDRIYARAIADPPMKGAFLRLTQERAHTDASFWRIQIVP